MKQHTILFALILAFASLTFAQDKTTKTEKTETKKTEITKTETTKTVTENVKLPTAKKVFEDYIKASGGMKAIEKVKSRSTIGTVELAGMGLSGNFEILSKAPNKSIMTMNLTGFGEITEAFDGAEAWAKNPMQGLRVKTGAELEEVKRTSDLNYEFNLDKTYPKAVVSGIEKQNGAEVYVVKGDDDTTMYFDKTTSLMTRIDRTVTSPQGKINSITKFEDYRDVDGTKQSYRFRQSALGAEFVFNVTDFKQNVEIADEKFSKPK